jgi:hypothetical protein
MTSKPKFGVEIWQLLTCLTIVLSVASSLMWFSNLQPYNSLVEFTWMDQAKSNMYNLYQKISKDHAETKNRILPSSVLTQSCYKDVMGVELDTSGEEKMSDTLLNVQQQIESIRQEYPSKISHFRSYSDFIGLLDMLEDYKKQVNSHHQLQTNFAKATLDLQKSTSQVCTSKLSEFQNSLNKFNKSLDEGKKLDLADYADWLNQSEEWGKITPALVESVQQKGLNSDETKNLITKFRTGFINIFGVRYDSAKIDEAVENKENGFLDQLQKMEDWQNQTSSKESYLQGKYVQLKRD